MAKMWFHKPYAPFGYAWFFPLNEKIANIGLGVPGGQKLDVAKLLEKYINDMTNGRYTITNTFRASVPLTSPMRKVVKDNVMIVGDAARLVYSVFGAGSENALFSGCLAGIIAAKYIHREIPSLELYQDSMQFKISSLKKIYNIKVKICETEKKFLRIFRIGVSIAYFINKLSPDLLQRYILKTFEKDKFILESYNESPFVSYL